MSRGKGIHPVVSGNCFVHLGGKKKDPGGRRGKRLGAGKGDIPRKWRESGADLVR